MLVFWWCLRGLIKECGKVAVWDIGFSSINETTQLWIDFRSIHFFHFFTKRRNYIQTCEAKSSRLRIKILHVFVLLKLFHSVKFCEPIVSWLTLPELSYVINIDWKTFFFFLPICENDAAHLFNNGGWILRPTVKFFRPPSAPHLIYISVCACAT